MTGPFKVSGEYVYRGGIIDVRKDTVKLPGGRKVERDVVEHRPCVAVVAVDSSGKILLVRQYRYPVNKQLLEIPAGIIDDGETPEQTAVRELQEETGYLPRKLTRLCGLYSSPGFCDEYLHLFLAEDLVPSRLHADDTDQITLVRIDAGEIRSLIESGVLCDAKSVAGLLLWLAQRSNH